MLQVLSQTNLDLTMFIGNDEPTFKIVGLNLGLLKKGYVCEGMGSIATTFMTDKYNDKTVEGLRVRFTKSDSTRSYSHSRYNHRSYQQRSFFKRKVINENTSIEMTISGGIKSSGRMEVSLRIIPSADDKKRLLDVDIISRYSNHIKTTEEMTIIPDISSSTDIKSDEFAAQSTQEKEDASKLHLDTIVARTKEFEDNFKYLYPMLVMRNFTGYNNGSLQQISLAEFDKFGKQTEILEEVSIPTKCARKKFIEICEIFRSNNVLTKLKANNFEFKKYNNNLSIDFFGIQMVNEESFKHFQYFDHPGINFCADFLDKSRTFDIVEAKISKEIITRI